MNKFILNKFSNQVITVINPDIIGQSQLQNQVKDFEFIQIQTLLIKTKIQLTRKAILAVLGLHSLVTCFLDCRANKNSGKKRKKSANKTKHKKDLLKYLFSSKLNTKFDVTQIF